MSNPNTRFFEHHHLCIVKSLVNKLLVPAIKLLW
jgi:hypothetical protein